MAEHGGEVEEVRRGLLHRQRRQAGKEQGVCQVGRGRLSDPQRSRRRSCPRVRRDRVGPEMGQPLDVLHRQGRQDPLHRQGCSSPPMPTTSRRNSKNWAWRSGHVTPTPSYRLSVISFQRSAVRHQLSAISSWLAQSRSGEQTSISDQQRVNAPLLSGSSPTAES